MSIGIFTDKAQSPTRRQIVEAVGSQYPVAEGRWLFIPVTSAQDIRDVKQLLALKSPPRSAVKPARTTKQ